MKCENSNKIIQSDSKQTILIGGMQKHQAVKTDGICTTLAASMGMGGYVPMVYKVGWEENKTLASNNAGKNGSQKIIVLGKLPIPGKDQLKRVYDPNGIAPTLGTMQGGYQEPKVLVREDSE